MEEYVDILEKIGRELKSSGFQLGGEDNISGHDINLMAIKETRGIGWRIIQCVAVTYMENVDREGTKDYSTSLVGYVKKHYTKKKYLFFELLPFVHLLQQNKNTFYCLPIIFTKRISQETRQ